MLLVSGWRYARLTNKDLKMSLFFSYFSLKISLFSVSNLIQFKFSVFAKEKTADLS
jgi:hypothetical protein